MTLQPFPSGLVGFREPSGTDEFEMSWTRARGKGAKVWVYERL